MEVNSTLILGVNLILFGWLILSIVNGYTKGLLIQLVGLVGLIVSIVVALTYSSTIASQFNIWPKEMALFQGTVLEQYFYNKMNMMLWFVLILVGCNLIFLLLKPVIKEISKVPVLHQINGLGGVVLSIVKYILSIMILISILRMPIITNGSEIVKKSYLSKAEEMTSSVLGTVEDKLMQNENIQMLISGEKDSLTAEDWNQIAEWLAKEGLSIDMITQFISEIQ